MPRIERQWVASERLDAGYVAFWAQRGAIGGSENEAQGVAVCGLAGLIGVALPVVAAPASSQGLLGALAIAFAVLIVTARLRVPLRHRVIASLLVCAGLLALAALSDPFGLDRTGEAYRTAAEAAPVPPAPPAETRPTVRSEEAPVLTTNGGYAVLTMPLADGSGIIWSIAQGDRRKRCGRLTILGAGNADLAERIRVVFERAVRASRSAGVLSCG